MEFIIKRMLVILSMSIGLQLSAQSFSFMHDGYLRSYIVHLPPGYNASNSYPMVMSFHGYTSNAVQQQLYTMMDFVADTANFIVVYPDGVANAWNVGFGAVPYNSGINDVGFVNALIDTMISDYSIDPEMIYATGMSNGGYLSNRLACELPHRIAAIASVTGPMTDSTMVHCNAWRAVPVMHIHGTADPVVPYTGMIQSLGAQELIDFWVNNNGCTATSTDVPYPDVNTADSCVAVRKNYIPCDDGAEVVLIEITDGGHTWPGSLIDIPTYGYTNRDFFGSGEIWNFFKRFRLGDFIGIQENISAQFLVYPNPVNDILYLDTDIDFELIDIHGRTVKSGSSNHQSITMDALPAGLYILKANIENYIITKRILKL